MTKSPSFLKSGRPYTFKNKFESIKSRKIKPKMKDLSNILKYFSITLTIALTNSITNYVCAIETNTRTVDDFIDSIGVNVHLSSTAVPGIPSALNPYYINWKPKENSSNSLFFLLKKSGIRHIRGGIVPSLDPEANRRSIEASKLAGIKSTVVVDTRNTGNRHSSLDPYKINYFLDILANTKLDVDKDGTNEYLKDAVEAIEGPNEYDLNNVGNYGKGNYSPNYWAPDLRDYQKLLFTELRSNSSYTLLSRKTIIAPSGGWLPQIYAQESIASIRNFFDKANFHPYPGPGFQELPSTASNLIQYSKEAQRHWNGKALWQTETGYTAAPNAPDGHGVSEKAQSKYISRLLAYSFGYQSIERTYLYQLCDEYFNRNGDDKELNFGLIGINNKSVPANGTAWTLRPKPSYFSIKNLIYLLKDKLNKFTPKPLDYTLNNGTDSLGTVYSLPLQKTNGHFFLLLWHETSSYDTKTKKDLNREKNIIVNFNNISVKGVNYAIPSSGTKWSPMIATNNTLQLNIPDEILILDITPGLLNKTLKGTRKTNFFQHGVNPSKYRRKHK